MLKAKKERLDGDDQSASTFPQYIVNKLSEVGEEI